MPGNWKFGHFKQGNTSFYNSSSSILPEQIRGSESLAMKNRIVFPSRLAFAPLIWLQTVDCYVQFIKATKQIL